MRRVIFFLSWGFLFFLYFSGPSMASTWVRLEPGLHYKAIQFKKSSPSDSTRSAPPYLLHVFKVNPKLFSFRTLIANPVPTSVRRMAEAAGAVVAVNANFFDPSGKPLGLVVAEGKGKNPIRPISWWGIFFVEKSKPSIVSSRDYQQRAAISTAVQAGPRLVINGVLPRLKSESSPKTAVGINQEGEVIVMATLFPMGIRELAELAVRSEKKGGLGCVNALNLDGGSSSQMYARSGSFELRLPSYVGVPVGLGVFRK